MQILILIVILMVLSAAIVGITRFSRYVKTHHKYELFAFPSLAKNAAAWALMIWGLYWRYRAINDPRVTFWPDPLNGLILFLIGLILYLMLTVKLYRRIGYHSATIALLIGWVIYPICGVIGTFGALMMISVAASTRPVYTINSSRRD